MALMAYCGMIDTCLNRNSSIAAESHDRQPRPVEEHLARDVAHAAVEVGQALAERGLAAAGLAGQAHDLAVSDAERDAVERLDVAAPGCGSRPGGR